MYSVYDEHKYVIVSCGGVEVSILLSCCLSHAGVVGHAVLPVSAGYVRVRAKGDELTAECWGRSESLGRSSRHEFDAAIIKRDLERTVVRSTA